MSTCKIMQIVGIHMKVKYIQSKPSTVNKTCFGNFKKGDLLQTNLFFDNRENYKDNKDI